MLPTTLTPPPPPSNGCGVSATRRVADAQPTTPRRACAARLVSRSFAGDRDTAPQAAAWCDRCPLADACLLEALRLDAAYRSGNDPWGISGCCGGVWFEPGLPPTRIAHTGWEIA